MLICENRGGLINLPMTTKMYSKCLDTFIGKKLGKEMACIKNMLIKCFGFEIGILMFTA